MKLRAEADGNAQLFPQLPVESILDRLIRLHLAPWKLPHTGEFWRRRSSGYEQSGRLSKGVEDGGTHHIDQSSHSIILWGTMDRALSCFCLWNIGTPFSVTDDGNKSYFKGYFVTPH